MSGAPNTAQTAPAALGAGPALRSAPALVGLTGALIAVSAAAMLASLGPRFRQLATPCDGLAFCFPPALFSHDIAALGRYGVSLGTYATLTFLAELIVSLGYLGLAGLLFWRRRADPMVLCTAAVLAVQPLALSGYLTAILDPAGPGRALLYAAALIAKVVIILFFALFPSGAIAPRAIRRYLPWLLLVVGAAVVAEAISPLNPLVRAGVYVVETGWMLSALLLQLYRYLYISSQAERRQTRWLMGMLALYFGYTIGFVWFIGTVGSPDGRLALVRVALFGLLYLLQLAVLYGTVVGLRRGLFNLDRIIGRTVVYTLLTLCVLALYILIVGGLSLLFRPSENLLASLLATGVIAVAFQPLRAALQRGVNQLFYGRRDDPREVVRSLARQLERAVAADTVMATIVETLTRELKLPYAAIVLDGQAAAAAAAGAPVEPLLSLPLIDADTVVGQLRIATRAPAEPFSRDERQLLDDLAHQAGAAVRAAQLNHELQRSRERLVTAREEERRRLQRDLHDELGPTLASLSMQLDAGRALLGEDRAAGEALLAEVQEQLRETIHAVRRLVHQLRPPMLDQLGLAAAIGEHGLRVERGAGMRVTLDVPPALPALSAAVEAAAYYIMVEALNNAARHARAGRCLVRLRAGLQLTIEVRDDGVGLPAHLEAGVGLRSMRERAQELGGSCQIVGAPGGGVLVRAYLPLARAAG